MSSSKQDTKVKYHRKTVVHPYSHGQMQSKKRPRLPSSQCLNKTLQQPRSRWYQKAGKIELKKKTK